MVTYYNFKPHTVVWDKNKIKNYWDFINETHSQKMYAASSTSDMLLYKLKNFLMAPKIILDIGFGSGELLKKLALLGHKCYGIDTSSETVSNFMKRNKLKEIKVEISNITNIPFKNIKFDLIFCMDVLEHLLESELIDGLSIIRERLGDQGILVITVPYNERLEDRYVICPDCGAIFHCVQHLHSFSENEVKNLLLDNGFKIMKIYRLDSDILRKKIELIILKIYRKITKKSKVLNNTMTVIATKA